MNTGPLSLEVYASQFPLHMAAKEGNILRVLDLLENGICANAKDQNGSTPLHLAAGHGNAEVIQALLRCGATITATNRFGFTPMHFAAMDNKTDLNTFTCLLNAHSPIDPIDNFGFTPLHIAASNNHPIAIQFLITNGANKETALSKRKRTPLHLATRNCNLAAIRALMDQRVNLHAEDSLKRTPIMTAFFEKEEATDPTVKAKWNLIIEYFKQQGAQLPEWLENRQRAQRAEPTPALCTPKKRSTESPYYQTIDKASHRPTMSPTTYWPEATTTSTCLFAFQPTSTVLPLLANNTVRVTELENSATPLTQTQSNDENKANADLARVTKQLKKTKISN